MTGLKVASHRDYSEPSTTFWNMQDSRIDSLDTGLPYSILDIVRSEILKNKTNHDLMSEEQINKEALYLLRFEYGEKMSLGIEVTQRVRDINLDLDLPMTEPTIDPTPEPTININRNAMIGRIMAG